jgi:type II secretory pathway pseudopilin PulG
MQVKNFKNTTGASLIAVVIVLVVVISVFIGGWYLNYREKMKLEAKTRADLEIIKSAIIRLGQDTLYWPGNTRPYQVDGGAGVAFCTNKDIACSNSLFGTNAGLTATDGSYLNWQGPYLRSAMLDPWGHEYFYETAYKLNNNFTACKISDDACRPASVIGSFGPNGVPHDLDDIILTLKI